ncbi:MAG: hypothetical protein FWF01_02985 [Alphaproteobacteria bacterium]|nr:hypothetical protein [Alphaproteobacteria bacterium]
MSEKEQEILRVGRDKVTGEFIGAINVGALSGKEFTEADVRFMFYASDTIKGLLEKAGELSEPARETFREFLLKTADFIAPGQSREGNAEDMTRDPSQDGNKAENAITTPERVNTDAQEYVAATPPPPPPEEIKEEVKDAIEAIAEIAADTGLPVGSTQEVLQAASAMAGVAVDTSAGLPPGTTAQVAHQVVQAASDLVETHTAAHVAEQSQTPGPGAATPGPAPDIIADTLVEVVEKNPAPVAAVDNQSAPQTLDAIVAGLEKPAPDVSVPETFAEPPAAATSDVSAPPTEAKPVENNTADPASAAMAALDSSINAGTSEKTDSGAAVPTKTSENLETLKTLHASLPALQNGG